MQSVTTLSLPELAMETPEFADDPFSRFAAARRQHPWLAKSTFGYVITEYAAIRDLLGMDDVLRVAHEGVVALMKAEGSKCGYRTCKVYGLGRDSDGIIIQAKRYELAVSNRMFASLPLVHVKTMVRRPAFR